MNMTCRQFLFPPRTFSKLLIVRGVKKKRGSWEDKLCGEWGEEKNSKPNNHQHLSSYMLQPHSDRELLLPTYDLLARPMK
jgi:hypothetical protein